MKNLTSQLDNNTIISFIKSHAPKEISEQIHDLQTQNFVFVDSEKNCKQCFFVNHNNFFDYTSDYAMALFNDYFFEINDWQGNSYSLTQIWRKFLKSNTHSTQDNKKKTFKYLKLKDCICSYMLGFDTNIACISEIVDYSKYLQKELTTDDTCVITLYDNNHIEELKHTDDDLIVASYSRFMLADYNDEEELRKYLTSSIDPELYESLQSAQLKYVQHRIISSK